MDREALWTYLESHKTSAMMPSPGELRQRFGEPDEILVTESTVNPSIWGVTDDSIWYARYSAEEAVLDWIPYDEWIYYHGETRERYVGILLRKDPPTLIGWHWSEDVDPGQESGPPSSKNSR